jgi:hypothetical protein
MPTGVWIAAVGGALGFLQVLVLFVLSDLRDRLCGSKRGRWERRETDWPI